MPDPADTSTNAISGNAADLRGAGRLTIDAVLGVTDLVEALHAGIASPASLVGKPASGSTRGITGLVYRSVRGVTRLVGAGLDTALAALAPLLDGSRALPQREALLAALNGVLGDHLHATHNPLAIRMQLRRDGQALTLDRDALAAAFPRPGSRLLVLAHGLCMNDLQWSRDGHDHAASLARDPGYTTIHLHYNSGRRISANGREFAELIERLLQAWPAAVDEVVIVCHSMGGLVSRSACHYAELAGHGWRQRLRALVFLGTPHHGAPLERAGNWVQTLLGVTPYSAPFARLGRIRSDGIRDLRYGNLRDEDWQGRNPEARRDRRTALPLPDAVRCYAIAATRQVDAHGRGTRLPGDGLVPIASALGRHRNPDRDLRIPPDRQWIGHGMNHFDLLGSDAVCERVRRWLAET